MIAAGHHVQLLDHLPPEPVLGEHPPDRPLDRCDRPPLEELSVGDALDPAGVSGVAVGDLVTTLVPGQLHLVGVDHDHVIAGVHVRSEDRLVLAAQQHRHLGRQPAQHLAAGVQDEPATLDVLRLGRIGLHREDVGPGGPTGQQGYLRERRAVKGRTSQEMEPTRAGAPRGRARTAGVRGVPGRRGSTPTDPVSPAGGHPHP